MLFLKRNEVKKTGPQGISATYGWVRNGGKTWHGGIDINGLDDKVIHMPSYNGRSISGTVVQSRIVTSHLDPTWEWGYYVCIKLDNNQTPDIVNYLYFCHNEKNLVQVGTKVKTGDNISIMGKTGNAASTYEHCHFEVRQYTSSKGLDPTAYIGFKNAAGIYEDKTVPTSENFGLDISHHQSKIDFNEIEKVGKSKFIIARTGFGSGSEENLDKIFQPAKKFCLENNVPFGAYHFSYASNKKDAQDEADTCIKALDGTKCKLGVYYDLEYEGMNWVEKNTSTRFTKEVVQELTIAFCEKVKNAGYDAGVYVNKDMYDRFYGDDFFKNTGFKFWYARPGLSTPDKKCDIWQYASDNGIEYGYDGNIDQNICYFDLSSNVPMYIITVGPASKGDKDNIENQAKLLGLATKVIGV